MRVVFVADTHLGFDYPAKPRVVRSHRGADFFANFERVLDHARRVEADILVHGGDVFHRARVRPAVVNRAYEDLGRLARSGTSVFLVPGNHDRSRLPGSFWLQDPNIHVFDRPRTFSFTRSGVTVALSGFPFAWGDVRHRFPELLAATRWQETAADVRLLCMHHAVEGATVGPTDFTFRSGPDVLRRRDLSSEFNLVLAGHVHRAQVLHDGSGVPEVVYAGSVERTSFAERFEPKGFYDLTFAAGNDDCAAVRDLNFIELPSRPMVNLRIGRARSAEETLRLLLDRAGSVPENAIVRVDEGEPQPRLAATILRSAFPPSVSVQAAYRFRMKAGR